jgi:tRNA(Ile)-lysidine synthase
MSFLKRFQSSLESLYTLPENARYVIAYSGGVDSHVLLHCCKQLDIPLRAVHVHHGLQSVADYWVNHCQSICDAQKIPLDIIYVDAKQKRGQSPEETARNARYDALQKNLTDGDCLLTAQHLNDQAETLLLQLFRTATSAGLSAMPECREIGDNVHVRPLLSFSREEIENYAEENGLHWIEDPSNQDVTIDRNYIRTNLVPLLESRWPEITVQLSKVAKLQANNLQVLEDMAAIDLSNAITEPVYRSILGLYEVASVISITVLKQLSSPRLLNVLRSWIIKNIESSHRRTSPTRNLLEEIEKTIINAQQDASPVIAFSGYEFRKYQSDLYLLMPKWSQSVINTVVSTEVEWKLMSPLDVSEWKIRLVAVRKIGEGLQQNLIEGSLKIRFREGGESFHPAGRRHSQRLKKLLQAEGIPPWERDTLPLLYYKDELVAVAGLWIAKKYAASGNESGWVIEIQNQKAGKF